MLTKLGDLRDVILLALAGGLIGVLAVAGTLDHETTKNALLVFLGIVGGAVTMSAKASPPAGGIGQP